jgi:uncharacterized protein with FMN-binding domain
MKRALPAIAVSAAGVTWLLHAQGVIDTSASTHGSAVVSTDAGATRATSTTSASSSTTLGRSFRGDDEDEGPVPPRRSTTTAPKASTTTASPGNAGGTRTSDGPVIDTRFGPVQVEAVLQGSTLIDVKVLQYPNEARRSEAINEQALPMLHDQAMSAHGAQIDGVSGATYTSSGYQQSLQAALDNAK